MASEAFRIRPVVRSRRDGRGGPPVRQRPRSPRGDLFLVPLEGGQRPLLVRTGAAAEGARRKPQMDAQVEGKPVPEQQRPVHDEHRAVRQPLIRTACGAVGHRVPEVGQHTSAAARLQRAEDLAPERAGVEPPAVVRVGITLPVLVSQ